MASGTSSREKLGERRPADNNLAGVCRPKTSDAGVVKELDEGPMCGQHRGTANGYDGSQILRDEGRLCPFFRTKLDRCVGKHNINEDPGEEYNGFRQARRVEDTVDEFPG